MGNHRHAHSFTHSLTHIPLQTQLSVLGLQPLLQPSAAHLQTPALNMCEQRESGTTHTCSASLTAASVSCWWMRDCSRISSLKCSVREVACRCGQGTETYSRGKGRGRGHIDSCQHQRKTCAPQKCSVREVSCRCVGEGGHVHQGKRRAGGAHRQPSAHNTCAPQKCSVREVSC